MREGIVFQLSGSPSRKRKELVAKAPKWVKMSKPETRPRNQRTARSAQPRGRGGGRWEPAPGTRREAVPSKTSPGPFRAGTTRSPPPLGRRHLLPSPWRAHCRVRGVGSVSPKETTSAAGTSGSGRLRCPGETPRGLEDPACALGVRAISVIGPIALSFLSAFNSLISLFHTFVE